MPQSYFENDPLVESIFDFKVAPWGTQMWPNIGDLAETSVTLQTFGKKHFLTQSPSYKSPSGSTYFLGHYTKSLVSVYPQTYWLVVSTPLKNISQIGSSSQLLGKIKNVPNQQTAYCGLHDALSFQQFSRLGFGKSFFFFFHFPIEPRLYPPFQDKCEDHNGWVQKNHLHFNNYLDIHHIFRNLPLTFASWLWGIPLMGNLNMSGRTPYQRV